MKLDLDAIERWNDGGRIGSLDHPTVVALVRVARALQRCCEETDYCYACDCHPSHGHAADCPLR